MKKILAVTIALLLVFAGLPLQCMAAEQENRAYITVEASTIGCEPFVYPVSVAVGKNDNASTVLLDVIKEYYPQYEISFSTEYGFYLQGIGNTGVQEAVIPDCIKSNLGENLVSQTNTNDMIGDCDFSKQECFMYSVNNSAPSVSMSDYKVQNGDVIRVQLSLAWGADIGMGWGNNFFDVADKDELIRLLADLKDDYDAVKPLYDNAYLAFLTPDASQDEVDSAAYLLKSESEKAKKVNETAQIITNAISARKTNDEIDGSILSSSAFLNNAGSSLTDWTAIAMSRFTNISSDDEISFAYDDGGYDEYLNSLEDYVYNAYSENNGMLSTTSPTEWHRISLAILSLGGDPTNVRGINLIADGTYNSVVDPDMQGLNAWVWGLVTLGSGDYEVPENAKYTVETFIDKILSARLSDGGWAFFGDKSDVDMTSMAVTALAPFYGNNEAVKTAIDEAVELLSSVQCDSGAFETWGSENSMTTAQAVIALTSVGINPDTDERFIKSGNSAIDALLSFQCEGGGFKYDLSEGSLFMNGANDQALEALVSYYRLITNQTRLFDFSDVSITKLMSGDADCDGKLSIKDATAIQKHIADIMYLSEIGKINADTTGDGKISISDATLIQHILAR